MNLWLNNVDFGKGRGLMVYICLFCFAKLAHLPKCNSQLIILSSHVFEAHNFFLGGINCN